jgi:hypothetical protein
MSTPAAPLVVSLEMGYGHLRAAYPIAEALQQPVLQADREPLADGDEQRLWSRVRQAYELTSRLSQLPVLGGPLKLALDRVTRIPPPHPRRDLSSPTVQTWLLDRLIARGLGKGMVEALRDHGRPLVTTFFVPALVADRAGLDDVYCVVTDTDINRSWAPARAGGTLIHYLVPSHAAARRLGQYGVPPQRITLTGFPLPESLLGGPDLPALRRNLMARLVRLDPARAFRCEVAEDVAHFLGALPPEEERRAPLLVFAVGGAGAQAELARRFLPSLRAPLLEGRLRLALVAGVKEPVREVFEEARAEARLEGCPGLEILCEADFGAYYRRFNALLADADVLWTKPSEMSFYAALGLPLVCAPPVGVHERRNRRWVREAGAGVKQRDPRLAGEWLLDLIEDGQLAAAAWAGYTRLPKFGLYRILEHLGAAGSEVPAPARSAGTCSPPPVSALYLRGSRRGP